MFDYLKLREIRAQLDRMEHLLYTLTRDDKLILRNQEHIMSQLTDALDQAETAAAANSAADDSAEALLVSISQMIADLKNNQTDPATVARITALADALNARAAKLGAAVTANTPAAT